MKVLRPELGESLGAERFLHEIKLTASLNHPHILPLHDSGEAGGFLFYVMPFVEGETLRERLDREGHLPVNEAVQIAREVAGALSFAHHMGVVHRDIKPDNILLTAGHAVVADFGIARAVSVAGGERLTATGVYLGTPVYMSPEQGLGQEVDERADIYALGCVLFEMLAGDVPFPGTNAQAILARKVAEGPPGLRVVRDSVSEALDEAVAKALARVPADRYRDAEALADALASTASAPAKEVRASSIPSKWRRRLAYSVPAGAAALVIAWALLGRDGSPPGEVGGTIRQLTSFIGWEFSPSWSPDGSMITYSHVVGGDADIATVPTRGSDPHILATGRRGGELRLHARRQIHRPEGHITRIHQPGEHQLLSVGRPGIGAQCATPGAHPLQERNVGLHHLVLCPSGRGDPVDVRSVATIGYERDPGAIG
ncbi:MAG: protein kinase, partial [Gemmatimonadota bacterium]